MRTRIGVSSCLVGQKVRYDGNSRPHDFIIDKLSAVFELVPVCPEAGIGMGVPRPPIHLLGDRKTRQAVGVDDPSLNVTDALQEYASKTARSLPPIAGYIFKSRSPSCGVGSVQVTSYAGNILDDGTGLFAQGIMQAMPLLPAAEETCLDDPEQRDLFLERVFIYQRWLAFRSCPLTIPGLEDFHTRHQLSVMARGEDACRDIGTIINNRSSDVLAVLAEKYIAALMRIVKRNVSVAQHVNVLRYAVSMLEAQLPEQLLNELDASIHDYETGAIKRNIPLKKLHDLLGCHSHQWLQKQVYLFPSKQEEALRF